MSDPSKTIAQEVSKETDIPQNNPFPMRPMFMIISILIVVFSFSMMKASLDFPTWQPWILMLIGLVLFLLTWIPPEKIPFIHKLEKLFATIQQNTGLYPVQLGLLFLSLFLLILVRISAGNELMMKIPWLAVGAWLLSIIFGFLGGWKKTSDRWNWEKVWQIGVWVLAFTVLGVFLRAIDIAHIPLNLTGDEASAGLFELEFLDHRWNNIFRVGWYEFPSLYFIIPASVISIFGQTTEALRLPSALAGGLTVGMLYLLGRVLYNHRVGVIAAALLAASHFHIHFSRIGLNNIWDGLFFVLYLGIFWRAWQKEDRKLYLLAGLVLGLSQYFYASSRILLGLSIVWLVLLAITDFQKLKKQLGSLLLMFWLSWLVFGPLALYLVRSVDSFMAPMSRVMFTPEMANQMMTAGQTSVWQVYLSQLVNGLGAYSFVVTRHWYTPAAPILLFLEAGFFTLGILLLWFHWRDPRTWMLLSWLAAFGVMAAMSESAPASQRYGASVAGAMIVVALAMDEIANRFQTLWPKIPQWATNLCLGLLVLTAMGININFYFRDYTPSSINKDINTLVAQRLADWLQSKPGEWEVVFFGSPMMGYHSIASLDFLATNTVGLDAYEPWGSEKNPKPQGQNVAFVFLPQLEADHIAAQAQYPNCKGYTEEVEGIGVLFNLWECSPFTP